MEEIDIFYIFYLNNEFLNFTMSEDLIEKIEGRQLRRGMLKRNEQVVSKKCFSFKCEYINREICDNFNEKGFLIKPKKSSHEYSLF